MFAPGSKVVFKQALCHFWIVISLEFNMEKCFLSVQDDIQKGIRFKLLARELS